MKHRIAAVIGFTLVLTACVPAFTLVNPGFISVNGLAVDAAGVWNQAPAALTGNLRKDARLWTRDGPLLDRLLLIPAVPDGEPLLVDRSKTAALPVFRADMLANELQELTESTLVKYFGEGSSAVNTSGLRPHRFGDNRGILFDFDAAVNDSPNYSGVAGAFIAEGALYLVVYVAAEPYYYEKHKADAINIIRSARVQASG